MNGPNSLPGLHLLDLSALVAGYAMASLLVRAFWPSGGTSGGAVFVVLGLNRARHDRRKPELSPRLWQEDQG